MRSLNNLANAPRHNKLLDLYPAHSVCRRAKAAHGVCRIRWFSALFCLAALNVSIAVTICTPAFGWLSREQVLLSPGRVALLGPAPTATGHSTGSLATRRVERPAWCGRKLGRTGGVTRTLETRRITRVAWRSKSPSRFRGTGNSAATVRVEQELPVQQRSGSSFAIAIIAVLGFFVFALVLIGTVILLAFRATRRVGAIFLGIGFLVPVLVGALFWFSNGMYVEPRRPR